MSKTRHLKETSKAWQIGFYFGLLSLLLGLGRPDSSLAGIPILFLLKNRFHLNAWGVSQFGALVAVPLYVSFLFGFWRDRQRGSGWSDRRFLLTFVPVAAGCYLWLAVGEISYARLVAGTLLATLAYQPLLTSAQALMTSVGQQERMTGRLSALWKVAMEKAPSIVAAVGGGWLAARGSTRVTFLVLAAVTALIAGAALRRPQVVGEATVGTAGSAEASWHAVRRLLRHQPLWPAALVLLLWNASPGWGTPLSFYLIDHVKLSEQSLGNASAVYVVCYAVAGALYGYLCQRLPLKRLLYWSTGLSLIAGPPFLLIQNLSQAAIVLGATGLLIGVAGTAFWDLLMRSCPRGFEGTGFMVGASAYTLAAAAADLVGGWLYTRGGFGLALAITVLVTLLIFPVFRLVPESVVATRDGEPGKEVAGIAGEPV